MDKTVTELHMNHVRALLARVRDGHSAESHPEGIFLGADDGEFLQELVGFRLAGMRSSVLAVLRFQKHGLPGIQFARESLAGYLARLPAAPQSGPFAAPAGRIVALMPRVHEPIPRFLKGSPGRTGHAVHGAGPPSDSRGFRLPSPQPVRAGDRQAASWAAADLRGSDCGRPGSDGPVPRPGRSGGPPIPGPDRHRTSHAAGLLRLPSVMLNVSWVATSMDVTEEATRLAAAAWIPFLASEASADVVLGLPATHRSAPLYPRP